MEIEANFPEKLQCLFEAKRYKVLYGGRGAGRSWGVARALLLIGTKKAIRVLCVRELQNSLNESVHKLLSDQIEALGLSHFYEVQVGKIIGKNGTTFSFEGIKNNTTRIKSYEAIDYCWVEEANKVSRASWGILIPTIRKEGSEIWITFNPELETDYTYVRFVLNSDDRTASVVRMTYEDNPWFPDVLKVEMEADKIRDPDYYLNVWRGNCLQMLEGVIFAKELRKAQEDGRICSVPYDNETPVDTFWDLGKRDQTAIWFAQTVAMQRRVVAYIEASGEDVSYYIRELQRKPYIYGTMYLPHDAAHKRLGQVRTIEQQIRAAGSWKVSVIPRTSAKVNAINAGRMIFPTCWFDEELCADGLQRLRHYKFKVKDGQYSEEPQHDDNSNGADAFMTMGMFLRDPKSKKSSTFEKTKRALGLSSRDASLGWMG